MNMAMQTETQKMPQLRFSEFQAEWENAKLGGISTKVGSGSTPRGGRDAYEGEGVPFIRSQNVNHDRLLLEDLVFISQEIDQSMAGSRVYPNDILLNITGASIGRSCVVPEDFERGNVNQHVCIVRLNSGYSPQYLQCLLSSYGGQKAIMQTQAGGGREGLNFKSVRSLSFHFPKSSEQTKIAEFLTAVDERVQGLSKKKELLEQYKKGVMQKIFNQEIRFTQNDDTPFPDWEEKELGQISFKPSNRNNDENITDVLTNSAIKGIVNQQDYFDKDIAVQGNLGNYHIVDINDFVYNPRISNSAPVGPLNRNNVTQGVMSPLYTVLRFAEGNLDYLECFFSTASWHKYMHSIANFGARHDRMNVTTADFAKMPIPFPHVDEQKKIADFLSAINDKITVVTNQLDAAKNFKKGLLQQMFV